MQVHIVRLLKSVYRVPVYHFFKWYVNYIKNSKNTSLIYQYYVVYKIENIVNTE